MVMKNGYRSIGIAIILAVSSLGISCEKGLLTNNDYTTGSSAAKSISDSSKDELSSLMHQQAQTLPAPVIAQQPVQKSIITTSAVNPDLPFTVVPLDEFGRYTDTIKANIDDVVYIELQGVMTGYYNGAILVKATGADIISIEEGYDYWWNGIGLWWTPASADTTKGGAGTLYNYKHIHSPVSDTYKSEGSSWATAWEAEANQYGYPYGPAGSLVTGTAPSEARFYFSGYLGNHSATRPGLRLGLRLKDSSAVGINITGHNRYEFSWLNLATVYNGTISVTPRGNYQSVHSEGENCWAQVSGPISATVGDTIAVTTYGELMMDAGQYSAVVERIDDGITATLTTTGVAVGNEFGPIGFSLAITSASPHGVTLDITSLGIHPGLVKSSTLWYTVSLFPDIIPPVTIIDPPLILNNYDCTTASSVTVILTASDPENPAHPIDKQIISGVDYINYEILTGTNRASQGIVTSTAISTTIIISDEGIYQIKYRAVDKAGNKEKPDNDPNEPWLIKNIIIDYSDPAITATQGTLSPGTFIPSPGGQVFATGSTLTNTNAVTDSISGVAKVDIETTGKNAAGITVSATSSVIPTNGTFTISIPNVIANGYGTISVTATDKAGNVSPTVTFKFFLDNAPPTLTRTYSSAPNIGYWYNMTTTGSVRVTFSATDPPQSSGMRPLPSLIPFNKDIKFLQTFTAFDNAGNESNSVEVRVWIDRTPPEIEVTLGSGHSLGIVGSIKETGEVSGDRLVAALKAVTTVTDATSKLQGVPQYAAPNFRIGSSVTATITATDKAGNQTVKTVQNIKTFLIPN